ncbi:MAG: hypothetical protein U0905_18205 [Pirellulales bacterium]
MKSIQVLGLLLLGLSASGCRTVLPTCTCSQLWPTYIGQQADQNYAQHHGCVPGTCRCGVGNPKQDYYQGYHRGFVEQASCRMGVTPCPNTLCGWQWIERGHPQPATPSYAQGYASGQMDGASQPLVGNR